MAELAALILFGVATAALILLYQSQVREDLLREEITRWEAFVTAMRGDSRHD